MSDTDARRLIEELDACFLELHETKERAFWNTHMGISDERDDLARAELALKSFLSDTDRLEKLRALQTNGVSDDEILRTIAGWIRTFERNGLRNPEERALYEENVEHEKTLLAARSRMQLGYVDPSTGRTERASSVALANAVHAGTSEAERRAAFEGLRSIETFVLENGFPDLVKHRNRFARAAGYEDFYDHHVSVSEGFGKKKLFQMLDDLEAMTRTRAESERHALAEREGPDALRPWNVLFHSSGSLAAEREPYFRFEDALSRWMRSFQGMGIRFAGATMSLDLLDREGKYENGFMHGPVPVHVRDGVRTPAEINFTANAMPGRVGSGHRAVKTLFHEGGHAAHFANIRTNSPCFSHEFAPMSTAMAETQSMFVDSVLGDADWLVRYAKDDAGRPIPFELIERDIRLTRPFFAQQLRGMLSICYAEKAIYELDDEEVTSERILATVREVEDRLVGTPGGAPRPILSVPHLLSWESAAQYHGYVLALMAVHQTRAYARDAYGHIVDNPAIGERLASVYWAPGSARGFLELVEEMTGRPLSGHAIAAEANRPVAAVVEDARARIEAIGSVPAVTGPIDLDVRLRIVHGTETIVGEDVSLEDAAERFAAWVRDLAKDEATRG